MKQRFQPLSAEIGGYIKTWFIIWGILFLVIFILGGVRYWSFFAGVGLGFILTWPIYFLLLWLTGVRAPREFTINDIGERIQ